MTTSAQSINIGGQNFTKRTPCKYTPGVKAQKFNFFISLFYMCECSCQRSGGVIITDLIDDLITNIFGLLSVPNKIPNLPNKKIFPNGMLP
jgi:hypothetical protein